jgi:disulfide bond formation protein DsbB
MSIVTDYDSLAALKDFDRTRILLVALARGRPGGSDRCGASPAADAQRSEAPISLPPLHRYIGRSSWCRPPPGRPLWHQRRPIADTDHSGMTDLTLSTIRSRPVAAAAAAIAVVGAVTILGAWFFQYGLGLKPCPLCLEQRYAYYFAIPLAVMVILGDRVGAKRTVLTAALVAIALGMLWNAGLGVYHAGVEWKWWEGPQECSGALDNLGSAGGLLRQLQSITVVRCDEAAWRFLGLSLAGYNVLISLVLAAIAAWGAAMEWRGRMARS